MLNWHGVVVVIVALLLLLFVFGDRSSEGALYAGSTLYTGSKATERCITREIVLAEVLAGNPTASVSSIRPDSGGRLGRIAEFYNSIPPATSWAPDLVLVFTRPNMTTAYIALFVDGCRVGSTLAPRGFVE